MNSVELSPDERSVLKADSPFRGAARVLLRRNSEKLRLDTFEQGRKLFEAGDLIEGLYLLVSGRVSLDAESISGLPAQQGFVEPGGVLGVTELLRASAGLDEEAPRHAFSASAAAAARAVFVPLGEVQRLLKDASRHPTSALFLNFLTDLAGSAAPAPPAKSGEHLLAEAIEQLVVDQERNLARMKDFHPMRLIATISGKDVMESMQKRFGGDFSNEQFRASARALADRGVIEQTVSHGPFSWRVNRWALTEYLRIASSGRLG